MVPYLIVGELVEAPVVLLLHLDRLLDQAFERLPRRGSQAIPPAPARADHVIVADEGARAAHGVERRLLAHAVPAPEARHQAVDDAGLERVRHLAEVHDDGRRLPGLKRRILDRPHAAHLLAGEVFRPGVAPLAADAHAEAHVPDAEHLDGLPLREPFDQLLVGVRLLQRIDRPDRRQHARPDDRHRIRVDRRRLADLHPGHFQVALAHRLEGFGNRVERASEIEARFAPGYDLRQAILEIGHRQRRGVRRRRKVRHEAQHDLSRLVLRVGRLRGKGECRQRSQTNRGGAAANTKNLIAVHNLLLVPGPAILRLQPAGLRTRSSAATGWPTV